MSLCTGSRQRLTAALQKRGGTPQARRVRRARNRRRREAGADVSSEASCSCHGLGGLRRAGGPRGAESWAAQLQHADTVVMGVGDMRSCTVDRTGHDLCCSARPCRATSAGQHNPHAGSLLQSFDLPGPRAAPWTTLDHHPQARGHGRMGHHARRGLLLARPPSPANTRRLQPGSLQQPLHPRPRSQSPTPRQPPAHNPPAPTGAVAAAT